MMRSHCDNCDALIVNAVANRRVTVQPWGYQCVVTVSIHKEEGKPCQELCVDCLRSAATAFIASLATALGREEATAADPIVRVVPALTLVIEGKNEPVKNGEPGSPVSQPAGREG